MLSKKVNMIVIIGSLWISQVSAIPDPASYIESVIDDNFRDRLGVNFYITGSSDITNKAELASITYDVTEDIGLTMGTSVVTPNIFHYVDLSLRNPWTLFSWQSSVEVGYGRFQDKQIPKSRISQSISLDYPLDESFSVQLMLKHFTKALNQIKLDNSFIAMGVGLRI